MKYSQSKYIFEMCKKLVFKFSMNYLNLNDVLFVRSSMNIINKNCEIFRFSQSLVSAFGKYYMIEVYPTFDSSPEWMQFRDLFHCLKHIPKDYKKENILLCHDYEAFYGEHLFTHDFKTQKLDDDKNPIGEVQ